MIDINNTIKSVNNENEITVEFVAEVLTKSIDKGEFKNKANHNAIYAKKYAALLNKFREPIRKLRAEGIRPRVISEILEEGIYFDGSIFKVIIPSHQIERYIRAEFPEFRRNEGGRDDV
ncbi:TPA: hypothetical protein ACF35N_004492 [Vibrio parahaemolyticus]